MKAWSRWILSLVFAGLMSVSEVMAGDHGSSKNQNRSYRRNAAFCTSYGWCYVPPRRRRRFRFYLNVGGVTVAFSTGGGYTGGGYYPSYSGYQSPMTYGPYYPTYGYGSYGSSYGGNGSNWMYPRYY